MRRFLKRMGGACLLASKRVQRALEVHWQHPRHSEPKTVATSSSTPPLGEPLKLKSSLDPIIEEAPDKLVTVCATDDQIETSAAALRRIGNMIVGAGNDNVPRHAGTGSNHFHFGISGDTSTAA